MRGKEGYLPFFFFFFASTTNISEDLCLDVFRVNEPRTHQNEQCLSAYVGSCPQGDVAVWVQVLANPPSPQPAARKMEGGCTGGCTTEALLLQC